MLGFGQVSFRHNEIASLVHKLADSLGRRSKVPGKLYTQKLMLDFLAPNSMEGFQKMFLAFDLSPNLPCFTCFYVFV